MAKTRKYKRIERNKIKTYSIILLNHGRLLRKVESFPTEKSAYKAFNKMIEESKEIKFPILSNNSYHVMEEADYELAIIKSKEYGDSHTTKIRDKSGEFVDYQTDDDDFVIVDKKTYYMEEKFWVYGYNPKLQRKTFDWIYENFVENVLSKEEFLTIAVYNNKVLFENGNNLEMVICKTMEDSRRMYNLIEEMLDKKKIKLVVLLGDLRYSKYKVDWMNKIQELTGWNRIKIKRNSTRP